MCGSLADIQSPTAEIRRKKKKEERKKKKPQDKNTPWAIKRSQLIFVGNFVKNQRILMQCSLLDLERNDSKNFTHLNLT